LKYPSKESHRRSVARSVIWRIMGVALLALITYLFTRDWVTTTLVTIIHHSVFILIYYLHERFWLRVKFLRNSRLKPYMRVITYEVILGNLVLGIITYVFTGELQTMTNITLIYISNKYWMYYAYDYIWGRIKWQTKE